MVALRKRIKRILFFIKGIDKEYIVEKYHSMRKLTWKDVKHFIVKFQKPIKYGIIGVISIMVFIPLGTYVYFVRDLATKDRIINRKNEGVVLLDRNEKPFFTLFDATTKNPVAIEQLPKYTPQAFIAIEDKDFYKHPGFSISGFARAVQQNILSEGYSQGGSTISQQLMKNTILSAQKRLLRKYQELVLAIELERRYSKDDILEMYINTNYYGEGAFGIQDAAKTYFSKDAKNLTLAESALLAGVIQAPSALSPVSGDVKRSMARKNLVLKLMADQGFITQAQMKQAQAQKIALQPSDSDINDEAVHFALMVQRELIDEYGEQTVAQSGFTVKTTLDIELQKTAQAAVATQVQRLATSGVTNGASVAIDPKTGEVLALVGSHNWSDKTNGKINMAVRARQPGSSFKPIIYARALDARYITASTQLKDEAIKFGDYEPRNYDNRFRGKVLVRQALANSLNIPAVHVMDLVGIKDGIKMAESLGITTLKNEDDYGLSLVLGAAEVPLIEMTNAYATFANQGTWNKYQLFLEVRDKNGTVILEKQPESRRALSSAVSYLISSILSDNKARAEVFGGALTISRTAAVKTGTTNDYKDSLAIGYTPQVAVGVWIGNNDNKAMNSVAGSIGAAPIWRQIMEAYLKDKPVENFVKPSAIEEEKVCKEDGLKIDTATDSAFVEYFIRGTKPTKMCSIIPSPTPTKTEDQLKKDEEEKKKKEEEEKKKNEPTNTPAPTSTSAPSPTSAVATPTTAPSPTSAVTITPAITITPTDIIPSI